MFRNNINSKKNFLAVSPLSIAKGPYDMLLKTIHAHRSSLPQVYRTKQVSMLCGFSFLPDIRMYDMSFHPIGISIHR